MPVVFPLFQHPAWVDKAQTRAVSAMWFLLTSLVVISGGSFWWFLVFAATIDTLWGAFAGPSKSGLGIAAVKATEALKPKTSKDNQGGARQFSSILFATIALIACYVRYQYNWTNFSGLLVILLLAAAFADAVLEVSVGTIAFEKLKAQGLVNQKLVNVN